MKKTALALALLAAGGVATAAERPACRAAIAWEGATVRGEAVECTLRDVLGELARGGSLHYSGSSAALDTPVSMRFRDETLDAALGRLLYGYSNFSVREDGVTRLVVTGLYERPSIRDDGESLTDRAVDDLPRWRVRQGDRVVEVVAGPGTTITPDELALFDLGDDVEPGPYEWDQFYPEQPPGTELTGPPPPEDEPPVELLSMDPDPFAMLPEPEQTLDPAELQRLEDSIVNFEPVYSETGPALRDPGDGGAWR